MAVISYLIKCNIIVIGLFAALREVSCKPCGYSMEYLSRDQTFNLDAVGFETDMDIRYTVLKNQNVCEFNLTEMYYNITKKSVIVNSKFPFILITIMCQNNACISFTSCQHVDRIEKSIYAIMQLNCVANIAGLELAKQYFKIHTFLMTNQFINVTDSNCSALQDVFSIYIELTCFADNMQDERLFLEHCAGKFTSNILQLNGCETHFYSLKQEALDKMKEQFPNLTSLVLKNINFSSTVLSFPWSSIYSGRLNYAPRPTPKKLLPLLFNDTFYKSEYTVDFYLDIKNCVVENALILNKSLTTVVINNAGISNITSALFESVQGLKILDLSFNCLEELQETILKRQTELRRLYLKRNNIRLLQEGLFDTLMHLTILDLSFNKLSKLRQSLFKNLTALEEIHLEHNEITYLSNDFLKDQIISLKYLSLSNNPLDAVPLYPLYCVNNVNIDMQFCSVSTKGFKKLVMSVNSNNMIGAYLGQFIDTYEEITAADFPKQKAILDLSYCNITDVYIDSNDTEMMYLRTLIFLATIKLEGNSLRCYCNYYIPSFLSVLYAQYGIEVDWRCAYPLELKGRLLRSLTKQDVFCEIINDNCPTGCFCYEHTGHTLIGLPRDNLTCNVYCENVHLATLPSALPHCKLQLYFKNTSLTELNERDYFKNTTYLDVSYNNLKHIPPSTIISWSDMEFLILSENQFTSLPYQISKLNVSYINVAGNPFLCDCRNIWLKNWLLKKTCPVMDWKDVKCANKKGVVSQMVSVPDDTFVCEMQGETLEIAEHVILPSIIIGSTLFVLVSISLLVYFQRLTIKVLLYMYFGIHPFDRQQDATVDLQYDCFIIHSDKDNYVKEIKLAEKLRDKGYKVAEMYTDFIVGYSFTKNVEIIVQKSKRVIFALIDDIHSDEEFTAWWNITYQNAIKHNMGSIILIADKNVKSTFTGNKRLNMYMKHKQYIKKHSKLLQNKVEYLMPCLVSGRELQQDEAIPMLQPSSSTNETNNKKVFVTYDDDLDHEIRLELVPYLRKHGFITNILEHYIMAGDDYRAEIEQVLETSCHYIFILTPQVLRNDVKMYFLETALTKNMCSDYNYLLLITSGVFSNDDIIYQKSKYPMLTRYKDTHMTIDLRNEQIRPKLLQALAEPPEHNYETECKSEF